MIEWRSVKGRCGMYRVSNTGLVQDEVSGLLLKPWGGRGYQRVSIPPSKVYDYVHRLVAMAFIPNPENKPEVDHIDGSRRNNQVSNLRWVSHLENVRNPITAERHVERIRETHRTPEFRAKLSAIRKDPEFQKRVRASYAPVWEKRRGQVYGNKPVRCAETGAVWVSCRALARQLGVSPTTVSRWLNGRRCPSNGLHYVFVKEALINGQD